MLTYVEVKNYPKFPKENNQSFYYNIKLHCFSAIKITNSLRYIEMSFSIIYEYFYVPCVLIFA